MQSIFSVILLISLYCDSMLHFPVWTYFWYVSLASKYGNIHLVERHLSEGEYQGFLRSSDIILLLYDKERYRTQTSGILAEALTYGRPCVVPKGTWMERQIENRGIGESFEGGDVESVLRALRRVIADYSDYYTSAFQYASEFYGLNNADRLCETILQLARHHGDLSVG